MGGYASEATGAHLTRTRANPIGAAAAIAAAAPNLERPYSYQLLRKRMYDSSITRMGGGMGMFDIDGRR